MVRHTAAVLLLSGVLCLPAIGVAETVIRLHSLTTINLTGWEEEATLEVARGFLSLTGTVEWMEGWVFTRGVLHVTYAADLLIATRLTVSAVGFQDWRCEVQVPLGELLTFVGELNFDPTGFVGGVASLSFYPGGVGAGVGAGAGLSFDGTGPIGQEIRLLINLDPVRAESVVSFGTAGFEDLDLGADVDLGEFALGGRVSFAREGVASVQATARASLGRLRVAGQGLFSPTVGYEVVVESDISLSDMGTLSGSAWITPTGVSRWTAQLQLEGSWFRVASRVNFASEGFLDVGVDLALFGEIGRVSAGVVWDRSGFRSLAVEIELRLTVEPGSRAAALSHD